MGEPTAILIQESLAKIGIKVTLEKIPGANWRTTLNKKELPMALNRFSGWLDYPEYYFYWNFHGNNSIFNISAYKSPAMDALIDKARFTEDAAEYEAAVKEFVALCMREVPVVPLNQPIHDVAHEEGRRRLSVLVPPGARLPAVPENLMRPRCVTGPSAGIKYLIEPVPAQHGGGAHCHHCDQPSSVFRLPSQWV